MTTDVVLTPYDPVTSCCRPNNCWTDFTVEEKSLKPDQEYQCESKSLGSESSKAQTQGCRNTNETFLKIWSNQTVFYSSGVVALGWHSLLLSSSCYLDNLYYHQWCQQQSQNGRFVDFVCLRKNIPTMWLLFFSFPSVLTQCVCISLQISVNVQYIPWIIM